MFGERNPKLRPDPIRPPDDTGGLGGIGSGPSAATADIPGVRIGIIDFSYALLGPAVALTRQGHDVRLFVPDNPFYVPGGELAAFHTFVLGRGLQGGLPAPDLAVDALLYADSFTDAHDALLNGEQLDAVLPQDPLRRSFHPHSLERRLERYLPEWSQHPNLVLLDMSDLGGPLHPDFRDHPGLRFKRECRPDHVAAGIRPYPYLFHPYLVALEMVGGLEGIRGTAPDRPLRDGWFCGTLQHSRYGERRNDALVRISHRHPGARLDCCQGGMATSRNLVELMASRSCLHPPGRGELCFRGHEAAALGVPLLVDEAPAVVMPEAMQSLYGRHLEALPGRDEVLQIYGDAASPLVAARALLTEIESGATDRRIGNSDGRQILSPKAQVPSPSQPSPTCATIPGR